MKYLSSLESYSSVNMTHFEHYFLEFAEFAEFTYCMGEKLSNIQAARSDLVLAIAKSFFRSIFFVGLTMDDES